jgi:hypothetical protein
MLPDGRSKETGVLLVSASEAVSSWVTVQGGIPCAGTGFAFGTIVLY